MPSPAVKKTTFFILTCVAMGALLPASFAGSTPGYGDPMRPPTAVNSATDSASEIPATAPSTTVETIGLHGPKGPFAIISGQRVSVGDRIGDDRVLRITENQVLLQGPGGKQILHLISGEETIQISRSTSPAPNPAGKTRSDKVEKK